MKNGDDVVPDAMRRKQKGHSYPLRFFFYYNKCNTEMQHQSLQCLCLLNAPSVRLSCHPLLIHLNKEEKEAAAATE
jgi:hypothetical protein